jgi:hypothetical protein
MFCIGTPAIAQTQAVQNDRPVQDNDITRQELARFDQFLEDHPQIAEQLRKDPSLVDNPEYQKGHPELQAYLADHPQIRDQIKQNPNVFMRDEDRYDRHEVIVAKWRASISSSTAIPKSPSSSAKIPRL